MPAVDVITDLLSLPQRNNNCISSENGLFSELGGKLFIYIYWKGFTVTIGKIPNHFMHDEFHTFTKTLPV